MHNKETREEEQEQEGLWLRLEIKSLQKRRIKKIVPYNESTGMEFPCSWI